LPALALACLLALTLSLTLALVDALAHAHAFAHVGYVTWRAAYLTLPLAHHALTLGSHSRVLVRAIRNPSGAWPRDFLEMSFFRHTRRFFPPSLGAEKPFIWARGDGAL